MNKKTTLVFFFILFAAVMCHVARAEDTGAVTAKTLNVRATPALDGAIVATLKQGDTVTILKENKEWLNVRTADGTAGWAAGVYIARENAKDDPAHVLSLAEAVFDNSYKVEQVKDSIHTVEVKDYNASRVMEAESLVEKAIASPGLKGMDRALLLRGRCKAVIGWYSAQLGVDFIKKHADEYIYNEVGADYVYLGGDFKTILSKYPGSAFADEAAFELANLPKPGECEGDTECMFQRQLAAFAPFFKKFPSSKLAIRAIELINSDSFDVWLDRDKLSAPIPKCCDAFDKKEMLKLVDDYYEAAQILKTPDRVYALHPIADAFAALGRKETAMGLYKKIISEFPKYSGIDRVKKSLDSLKKQ